MRLQMAKKSEEFEMGLDAQKSFAQMHEDRIYGQRNWGSDDEAGSCRSAGAQKRKKSKETPILVPSMR